MRINNHTAEDLSNVGMRVNASRTKSAARVNINNLMSKVRKDYKKQKKENLVVVGLVGSIVVITGIIASL